MIQSMTGFGAVQRSVDGLLYLLELKGVNNRYLKIALKLPEFLQFAETAVEKVIRDRVHRGTVTCTLRVRGESGGGAERINLAALQGYIDQITKARVPAGFQATIDLGAVADLPGVCESPEVGDEERVARLAIIESLTKEALDAFSAMRRDEGRTIRDDLSAGCRSIRERMEKIRERGPAVIEEYHERLRSRVAMLMEKGGYELDAQGLMREVAIYAERCDVSEEVSRLASHLDQFAELCARGDRVGRTLDFLTQELLREANTIGSKTNDMVIARCVVEMKSLVDRLKEQVQNVE